MKIDLLPWGEALLDVLFPPSCVACGTIASEPFCAVCAGMVEPEPEVEFDGLERTVAVWVYQGPVAVAIRRLKYRGSLDVARPLGVALRALTSGMPADIVVPMPLSHRRLLERGYNQAREMVRGHPGPVVVRALRRLDDGPSQVGQSKLERMKNLEGAFVADHRRVAGRRVLLVDDVVTTGATAQAAAVALRAAGAAAVMLAVVGATPLDASGHGQTAA